MNNRIMPAVVVTVGCVTTDDTLNPDALPLEIETIVPVPSRAVLAVETVALSIVRGTAAYVGFVAILCSCVNQK